MDNQNFNVNYANPQTIARPLEKTFIASVFSWMAAALAITGITAYVFGTDMSYFQYLVNIDVTGKITGMSGLGWLVTFAPIGFVFLMSLGYQRLSSTALIALYLVYSVIMGMSLSFIFLVYTHASIYSTFGVAAAMFGAMALVGYTTNTDLTKFGSIMMMGLIGIIIASIINFFVNSESFNYFITIIGVLVFTGLTAYDVQKLRRIGEGVEYGTEATAKLSIMGALNLYLDFINLFLFLLRLFGSRRN